MIVVLPAAIPVTTPDTEAMLPVAGALLLHTPPVVASLMVTVDVAQTAEAPVMAEGLGLTVTTCVAEQPSRV